MNEPARTTDFIENEIINPQTVTVGLTKTQMQHVNDASVFIEVAEYLLIESAKDYDFAVTNLREVMAGKKHVTETRLELTRPLNAVKKNIIDSTQPVIDQYDLCIRLYKTKMIAYETKMEDQRKEVEAKKRQIAQKEFDRLQKRAETADKKGNTETAEVLREQAESIPAPIVQSVVPKKAGISTRVTWYAEVVNKMDIIKAIAAGQIPLAGVKIDLPFFNKQAIALKGEFNYSGLVAKSKSDITVRQ